MDTLNVDNLLSLLRQLKKNGQVTGQTEIWLSSDEEGNTYSPLVKVNEEYNIGLEKDKSKLTLYPV